MDNKRKYKLIVPKDFELIISLRINTHMDKTSIYKTLC